MLKFNDFTEKKLYITGCLHGFHKQSFIWQKRGYSSPEEHTQGLIDTINKTCRETDTLFILGDITLNATEDNFYWFLKQIKPKIFSCWGNHNHPMDKLFLNYCQENFGYEVIGHEWLNKITSWGHYIEARWNGQFCCFGHYPIAVFNKMHHNSWSLHSHNHGSYLPSLASNTTIKQLDCGWDVWNKPISFQEIQKVMNNKKFVPMDHHDKGIN
jgi:calcineurin-like phosphoesterase family protein